MPIIISMNVSSMTTVLDSTVKCFAQLPSTPVQCNTTRTQTGAAER